MSLMVSVVLPVYNGEKYLRESVESILGQTLRDLELILINDRSTDGSGAILEEFSRLDARIRLYNNEENLGLPGTLNRGLELAGGEYIARMDQDDISLPDRLEKQVRYMRANPEVGICGSWAQLIGERADHIWKYPCTHEEIYARMLFANTLVHPSVIMRASTIHRHGLHYDTTQTHIEDYDLWSRALPLIRFANTPEPLLQYRLHGANTGNLHENEQHQKRLTIYRNLLDRLEIKFSEDELRLHEQLGLYQYQPDADFLLQTRHWLERLAEANQRLKLIAPDALNAELGERWKSACAHSQMDPFHLVREILQSPLQFGNTSGLRKVIPILKSSIRRAIFNRN